MSVIEELVLTVPETLCRNIFVCTGKDFENMCYKTILGMVYENKRY